MARNKSYLPIGKNKIYNIYHDLYDRARLESQILNAGNQRISIHSRFFNRSGIESMIAAITGDNQTNPGFYKRENTWVPATMPTLQKKLEEIKQRFKDWQQTRVNEGHRKLTEQDESWPPELLQQRLRTEAEMDCVREELDTLEKMLLKYTEPEDRERDKMILAYGCLGRGRLQGGILVEIDGQRVSLKNKILIIDEPSSIYFGMSVADYRQHVVIPYITAKKAKISQLYQARELERRENGHSNIQVPSFGIRKTNKNNLPKWPVGVINYLEQKDDVEDSGKIKSHRKRKQLIES